MHDIKNIGGADVRIVVFTEQEWKANKWKSRGSNLYDDSLYPAWEWLRGNEAVSIEIREDVVHVDGVKFDLVIILGVEGADDYV